MDTTRPFSGGAADPIVVRSVGAEYAYVESHPCTCGGGTWQRVMQTLVTGHQEEGFVDVVKVRCTGCGQAVEIFFRVDQTPEEAAAELQALEDALRAAEDEERKR